MEAECEEEARMLVQYLYLAEEIVLTADNHIETNVRVLEEGEKIICKTMSTKGSISEMV